MKKVSGLVEGTGSTLTVGCGFKPDYVKVVNIDSSTLESMEFSLSMAATTAIAEGIKRSGSTSVADSKLTSGNGISVYGGGDVAGASNTQYVVGDSGDKFTAASEGDIVPEGFNLANDSDVNVSAETIWFEAGFFD